jgi:hypothetical protein
VKIERFVEDRSGNPRPMWPFCSFEPEGTEIEMEIEKMRLLPYWIGRPPNGEPV